MGSDPKSQPARREGGARRGPAGGARTSLARPGPPPPPPPPSPAGAAAARERPGPASTRQESVDAVLSAARRHGCSTAVDSRRGGGRASGDAGGPPPPVAVLRVGRLWLGSTFRPGVGERGAALAVRAVAEETVLGPDLLHRRPVPRGRPFPVGPRPPVGPPPPRARLLGSKTKTDEIP